MCVCVCVCVCVCDVLYTYIDPHGVSTRGNSRLFIFFIFFIYGKCGNFIKTEKYIAS